MQLPEARLGPSVRRGFGAERPSWLRGHGWGLGAEGLLAPNLLPHEGNPVGSGFMNAVDSMQREEIEPYCKQWIICSMIECSRFHAASLNEVDFMRHGPKHPD